MSDIPLVKLNNGVEMPVLGFGVFQVPDLQVCEDSVYEALKAGYRLIDTASSYGNEEAVGKAIQRSGVPRDEIFVTSKLWVADANYEGAKAAYQTSLDKLQLDHLDLYLIHQPFNDVYGAWRAMEELLKADKVRAIGVSNFTPARMVDLILNNSVAPMVNQIETHVFNQQIEAQKVMQQYGVQHEGWAPFAEGKQGLFTNELLAGIGKQYGKTIGQVVLRWHIQRGVVVIPKSVKPERIAENFDVFDFELTNADMAKIATLDEHKKLFVDHEDPEFVVRLRNRK